jgi:hypothetical protein
VLFALSSAAAAQPEDDEFPVGDPGLDDPLDDDEVDPDPPEPQTEPDTVRSADNGTAAATPATVGQASTGAVASPDKRPEGLTMGIGFGYDLPADLMIPNITSVRFRFPGGLTFEPFVELSNASSSVEMAGIDIKDSDTTLEAGANVRIPMAERGPIDFILQAGAALSFSIADPEGPDNSTKNTLLAATWGVSLDWWVYRNIAVSLTGTNPFVLVTHQTVDQVGADNKTTNVLIGAIFEPNIILMGHLFY